MVANFSSLKHVKRALKKILTRVFYKRCVLGLYTEWKQMEFRGLNGNKASQTEKQ